MKRQLQQRTSRIVLSVICAWASMHASPLFANYYQKVDIVAKNKPLKSILQDLETQSNFYFLYDNDIVNKHKSLNVEINNMEFRDALDKLSKTIQVDYKIVDKTVTLYKQTSNRAQAQQEIMLTGIIRLKDAGSDVVRTTNGISVRIKGTNKGTTTNFKGEFSLAIPSNATIVVSNLGYVPIELDNVQTTRLELVLEQSDNAIDEVIVSAYGTKESKENQIGSAYTVTAKDIEKMPALRIDALLQGIVPGLEYSTQDENNSSPRPRFKTRIRGEASAPYGTMANDPLWVVDGVPLNTGGTTSMISGVETSISPLTYLNPNDIENVTVLKDASATAIYGASGSNGVIIINTKKGKGSPSINYGYRSSRTTLTNNRFQVLNGEQYRDVIHEMGLEDKIKVYGNVNTDWYDVFYRQGMTNLHNLSLSGSNENTSYYISGNIYDEKLSEIANSTKRYALRSQISTKLNDRIEASFILGGSFNNNKMFHISNDFFTNLPITSPYNPDGSYALYDYAGTRLSTSLAEAEQNDDNQRAMGGFAQGMFTVRIIDGLDFSSRNGIDFTSLNHNRYNSMYNLSGRANNGYAYKNQVQMYNWVSTNTLNYTKHIYDGVLTAILGMEANKDQSTFVGASGFNFPNDYLREINLTPAENRRSSGSSSMNSSLSYLGGVSYLFQNKYNAKFNFRRDGDSDFGANVKWGTFYAFGGAWTVSNESFWKSKAVNFLKLKASYGTTGNGRFDGNFAKGVYQYSDTHQYGDNIGAIMSRGRNENIKWETTYKFNTGLDFGLFDRFNIALEYYKNTTHDMIDDAYVSMTSGQRTVYRNVGKMQNQGFELMLLSNNINKNGLTWNTRFNLSLNRNKVLELAEGRDRNATNTIMREGYDARSLYMIRWAGVDPSTGDPMWYDANGNITKTYNTANRVIIGRPAPDFFGGMTNTVGYKNLFLSFQMNYSKGGLAISSLRRLVEHDGLNILTTNLPTNSLNHWQYPGDLALTPRLSTVANNSTLYSTRHVHSKSYISLKNVSLEYHLPAQWTSKIFTKRVSVYVQGDDLGFWTPYKNKIKHADGTVSNYNSSNSALSLSPYLATYSFGLNVSF